ncbi:hypothetical protein CR513_18552, partial [Mucuna pruriens]
MINFLLYLIASKLDIIFSVYLCARTTNLRLWFKKFDKYKLKDHYDVDYAGKQLRRQGINTLSIIEAKYILVAHCYSEFLWIKHQHLDYDIFESNIPLLCNNIVAMNHSKNTILHSRAKHIEIKHHLIRDYI